MKKVLFLMVLLFPLFSGTAFVNAQVRIGANAVLEKGTVLDLKSSAAAPGYVGGLLLLCNRNLCLGWNEMAGACFGVK